MIRYYVCGLGYDKNDCITDYEKAFGDFDTYEEAYEEFICRRDGSWMFIDSDIYKICLQLEECEETEEETECIDVLDEFSITNPNFKEE